MILLIGGLSGKGQIIERSTPHENISTGRGKLLISMGRSWITMTTRLSRVSFAHLANHGGGGSNTERDALWRLFTDMQKPLLHGSGCLKHPLWPAVSSCWPILLRSWPNGRSAFAAAQSSPYLFGHSFSQGHHVSASPYRPGVAVTWPYGHPPGMKKIDTARQTHPQTFFSKAESWS